MKPNINYNALIEMIDSIPQEELLDRIETVIFRERKKQKKVIKVGKAAFFDWRHGPGREVFRILWYDTEKEKYIVFYNGRPVEFRPYSNQGIIPETVGAIMHLDGTAF